MARVVIFLVICLRFYVNDAAVLTPINSSNSGKLSLAVVNHSNDTAAVLKPVQIVETTHILNFTQKLSQTLNPVVAPVTTPKQQRLLIFTQKPTTKATLHNVPDLLAGPVESENIDETKTRDSSSSFFSEFFLYVLVFLSLLLLCYVYRKKWLGFVMSSRRQSRRTGGGARYRRLSTNEAIID